MNAMTTPEVSARFERLRAMLDSDPENGPLLTDCAELALQLGRAEEAQDLAKRALGTAPDNRGLRYNLGYVSLHAGRYADAKEALLPIAEDPEAPPHTRHLLARALHYLGEVKEAAEQARRQVEANPDDAVAAGMLSLLYVDASDFAEAQRWSAHALERQPRNLDGLLAAGAVALGYEDEDKAKEAFAAALEVNPANGRALTGLGLTDMLNLDLRAARGKFERAAAAMPDYVGAWSALAWCQMLEKDYAAAHASLQRALALDQNVGETHGGLAMLAAFQGKWDDARQHTKRALALDPTSFGGRMAQVLELQRAGKADLARQIVERGLKAYKVPGGGSLAEMLNRFALKRRGGSKGPGRPG